MRKIVIIQGTCFQTIIFSHVGLLFGNHCFHFQLSFEQDSKPKWHMLIEARFFVITIQKHKERSKEMLLDMHWGPLSLFPQRRCIWDIIWPEHHHLHVVCHFVLTSQHPHQVLDIWSLSWYFPWTVQATWSSITLLKRGLFWLDWF